MSVALLMVRVSPRATLLTGHTTVLSHTWPDVNGLAEGFISIAPFLLCLSPSLSLHLLTSLTFTFDASFISCLGLITGQEKKQVRVIEIFFPPCFLYCFVSISPDLKCSSDKVSKHPVDEMPSFRAYIKHIHLLFLLFCFKQVALKKKASQ